MNYSRIFISICSQFLYALNICSKTKKKKFIFICTHSEIIRFSEEVEYSHESIFFFIISHSLKLDFLEEKVAFSNKSSKCIFNVTIQFVFKACSYGWIIHVSCGQDNLAEVADENMEKSGNLKGGAC